MNNALGLVFPGQGSQSVGMLGDIAKNYPEVRLLFAIASEVLGYDLWNLTQTGPAETLDNTEYTQPALLTASYALWQMLKKKLTQPPQLLAGHSLGEYTALVCAEAFSFPDAVQLVASRGKFMQEAVPVGEGALAAIVGLSNEMVNELCKTEAQQQILAPANYNSRGQVVVAGHQAAVQRAIVAAKAAGAKLAKLLPVSVPSHCILMKPAAEKLAPVLAKLNIQKPRLTVINNVDVKVYENPAEIRDGLVRQLFMPIRWVETIEYFAAHNIQRIIECGPGKVLTGLNKRIVDHIELCRLIMNCIPNKKIMTIHCNLLF